MPIDRLITSSIYRLASTNLEHGNNEAKELIINTISISNSPIISACSSNTMKNDQVIYKNNNEAAWGTQKKHGCEVIEDFNGRLDEHELNNNLSAEITHLLKSKTHYKVNPFNLYPSKEEKTARDFINENFEITLMTNHRTRVEYSYTNNRVESYFLNEYEINRWSFMSNERDINEKIF